MKWNFTKYFILVVFVVSCGKQEKELKIYGYNPFKSDSLNVTLKISDFTNYGQFIDRIKEITCNDSIPQILIERENINRIIYPIEYCEFISFHPRHRNTFFIYKDSISKNELKVENEDLSKLMAQNFKNMGEKSDFADRPDLVLFIFLYYEKNGIEGIEEQLEILAKSIDSLETKEELKISFWPKIEVIEIYEDDN